MWHGIGGRRGDNAALPEARDDGPGMRAPHIERHDARREAGLARRDDGDALYLRKGLFR